MTGTAEIWVDEDGNAQGGYLYNSDGSVLALCACTSRPDGILIHRVFDGGIDNLPLFRYFPEPGKMIFYSWIANDITNEIKVKNIGSEDLTVSIEGQEHTIPPSTTIIIWTNKGRE